MSDKTGIEWCDASWNPVTGCTKVSDGCKHCYAERYWARLSAPRATPNRYTGRKFTDVQCHADLLDLPLRWKKPRRVFVNSMSDLFHPEVSDDLIDSVFAVMTMLPRHTFQVLTKRPARMADYMRRNQNTEALRRLAPKVRGLPMPTDEVVDPWLRTHIWLGVSVEDQATAEQRIPLLLDTPAVVRWVSCEPLLGPVDLSRWLELGGTNTDRGLSNPGIDWVVVGGESGPKARPMHPDWVRRLRDQCAAAGAAFLFKQWGEYSPVIDYYSDNDIERDASLDRPYSLLSSRGYFWSEEYDGQPPPDTWVMHRVGKKAAGRLLDGRLHDAYPEVHL